MDRSGYGWSASKSEDGAHIASHAKLPATAQCMLRRGLCAAMLLGVWAALAAPAHAQITYTVSVQGDDGTGGTANTLSWAIKQANGTGGTINVQTNVSLSNSLTQISATAGNVTIAGNNHAIVANGHQVFTVATGTVAINNLAVSGAVVNGGNGGNGNGGGGGGLGAGGALYVDTPGRVTIQNVDFQNNQAVGGNGGNGNAALANGGNGGNYNANANAVAANSGGGVGTTTNGSPGGYGGGGAGVGITGTLAGGGNGGGNGGGRGIGGNGGNGLGGAVFVANGARLEIQSQSTFAASNTAIGGTGGTGTTTNGLNGPGSGGALYVGITSTALFNNSANDITITGDIYSNGHITITGTGAGVVNFLGSTFNSGLSTGITVATGTLNGNTASLQGNITNTANVRFTQTNTGTFDGRIIGTGSVSITGTGTVIFTQSNSYSGGTTIYSGTLQGNSASLQGAIQNNSQLIINQTTTGSFAGAISGTGSLLKTGTGAISFTGGQTYTGVTTISQGKLNVNGTQGGDFHILSAGTLGGSGFIIADVNNQGTIAPGNSIGTMHINGTFTSGPTSTLQIEINNGGTVAGVNNDLITVTGNVSLSGGTVAVQTNTNVGFTSGSRYSFLNFTGTRSGTFATSTINTPFLTSDLDYGAQDVAVIIQRSGTAYLTVADTPNQKQFAAYLDRNSPGATGDFAATLDEINQLSAAGARNAFDQLSGGIYGTAVRLNAQSTTYMYVLLERNTNFEGEFGSPHDANGRPYSADAREAQQDIVLVNYQDDDSTMPVFRLRPRQGNLWNAWAVGYGSFDTGKTAQTNIGNYSAAGNITSAYRYLSDIVKFGFFGAYNYVNLPTVTPTQTARTDDGQFGSYLRADDGVTHLLWAQSFGFDNYHSYRPIRFGAINALAQGSYNGWQATQYSELGRKFGSGIIDTEVFLGTQYTYLRQNGFQETGAGALNLNVGGIDANVFRTLLGLRMSTEIFGRYGLVVKPEFRTAWIHDYLRPTSTFNSTLAGVGGAAFQTTGADFGRDATLLGFGLNWAVTDYMSVAANYDGLYYNNSAMFHVGSASLQYRW